MVDSVLPRYEEDVDKVADLVNESYIEIFKDVSDRHEHPIYTNKAFARHLLLVTRQKWWFNEKMFQIIKAEKDCTY